MAASGLLPSSRSFSIFSDTRLFFARFRGLTRFLLMRGHPFCAERIFPTYVRCAIFSG